MDVPKDQPQLSLTVTASQTLDSTVATLVPPLPQQAELVMLQQWETENSFPPTPMEQGRSPGRESAETGPPHYTHSPFPSLGTHTAQVAAQDGFQNWEHSLSHTTTPFPSALWQSPCPRMKVNPLSRAPSSQDFHSPQSFRHI